MLEPLQRRCAYTAFCYHLMLGTHPHLVQMPALCKEEQSALVPGLLFVDQRHN